MNDRPNTPERNRNQNEEVILSGRISHAVWRIAWPTIINTLILTAYNIINRFFLGKLPDAADALAAVGIGGAALMVQFAITIGLSAGTGALVSQFLGAQKYDDADEATRQSLLLAVVTGLLSSMPLILFALPICQLIGAKAGVGPLAADYVAIISWYSVPLFIYMTTTTALRSAGDVISALYAGAVVILVNVILDYVLIFGVDIRGLGLHLHIPQMGVHGAAISTGLSRIAGVIVTSWFLRRSVLRQSLSHFRMHAGLARRIMAIGWPAMVQNLLWTLAYGAFIWILSHLPGSPSLIATVQAGLTLGLTIESTAFMPGVAYSMAATPLVGQNLGAQQPERAEQSAWMATWHAVAIMTFVAVLFVVFPRQIARAFTVDKALILVVVSYLQINAIAEPFMAVNMVLRGALQGAGDTMVPALITLGTHWLVRLPLAWLLAITLGYGAPGAFVAMAASNVLAGIVVAGWFKLGYWRRIAV